MVLNLFQEDVTTFVGISLYYRRSPIPNDFILFLKDCINTEPGVDEESEGILAASAQLLLLLTNSHFCNNAPSLSNLTNRCQSLPILASLRARGQKTLLYWVQGSFYHRMGCPKKDVNMKSIFRSARTSCRFVGPSISPVHPSRDNFS